MNKVLPVMTAKDLAILPRTKTNFSKMRSKGFIYVDKTAQLYDLACCSDCFFIARPRRFGKTLLISTFESLFKYGVRDFKGLAIEKLWDDHTYPVVHIDFSGCKVSTLDEFKKAYTEMLETAFELAGLQLPPVNERRQSVISRIEFLIKSSEDLEPVILIDEYDAPLNNCLDNENLFNEIRDELTLFYSMLKRISGGLRFFFFTGICKYKNLSIFSDTNFVTDLSLDPDYGTLLGYTEDEIREYFTPFVENAARVLGISSEECLAKLKRHYDGYCFDEKASTHVHTPWSVLSFLANPERGFCNYWNETGGRPSLLLNYVAEHALQDPSAYGENVYRTLDAVDSSREIRDLDDYALLYQTGYLTIIETSSSGDVVLNYPNEEVRSSMAKLYAEQIFRFNSPYAKIGMNAVKLFSTVALDEIPQKLNDVISCIDYNRFPIKDEAGLEAFLVVYAYGGGIEARAQVHNVHGRSDIEFAAGKRYFVFELKVVADKKEAGAKLDEAIAQIKNRHYGEGHAEGRELARMAMVFSLADRGFVATKAF